ncbi:SsrA-binding protein [Candidatus Saccharibacteria bacterium]|nr:SsrA-binding protein [Candidatus Saccharibacteria bacterium]
MAKKPTRRGHKTTANRLGAQIINRRASFDYELGDILTVGLQLTGAETKAARLGHVQLRGSYVTPKENSVTKKAELYLINASFSIATNVPKSSGEKPTTVDTRARKILAKRKEIDRLAMARASGQTIIPTKLLTNGHYIKLVIALGKGKKNYDKRASIRRRDTERDNAKFLKRL